MQFDKYGFAGETGVFNRFNTIYIYLFIAVSSHAVVKYRALNNTLLSYRVTEYLNTILTKNYETHTFNDTCNEMR